MKKHSFISINDSCLKNVMFREKHIFICLKLCASMSCLVRNLMVSHRQRMTRLKEGLDSLWLWFYCSSWHPLRAKLKHFIKIHQADPKAGYGPEEATILRNGRCHLQLLPFLKDRETFCFPFGLHNFSAVSIFMETISIRYIKLHSLQTPLVFFPQPLVWLAGKSLPAQPVQ